MILPCMILFSACDSSGKKMNDRENNTETINVDLIVYGQKIDAILTCVRKLFNELKLANPVRYEVVDTYGHLLDIMKKID